ncbi:MmgE/PrpD family protein [Thermodesulfobacteriota bacterium]
MSSEKKISEMLAEMAVNLRYNELPEEARKHAANLLLDLLGSMIGSKKIESSQMAANLALELGGPEESDVVGYPQKVSTTNAAFANAIQGYAFDYTDDHNESNCHPSVASIPASLALGQKLHATGKEIIEAIALGNEVVCRLGASFLGKTYYQGFHPTSTCGVFGAAISAAKLIKLDAQKTVWCLGIAGSQAAGLLEWNAEGSYTKRLQAGHPAMCGLLSAMLAEKGFNGPSTIFEGNTGFLNAYSLNREYDINQITKDLGNSWEFSKSSIKFYPCCRYSAGHLDACLEIVSKFHPDPESIRNISIRSSDFTINILTTPEDRKLRPKTTVDAQFSMPYQAASALIRGKVDIETFTEKCFTDPQVLELIKKVEWKIDEEFERRYPASYSCAVTLEMNDGKKYTSVIDDPKGDHRNPMTQEEIEKKFIDLARIEIPDERKIVHTIDYIHHIDDAADINDLFSIINGE